MAVRRTIMFLCGTILSIVVTRFFGIPTYSIPSTPPLSTTSISAKYPQAPQPTAVSTALLSYQGHPPDPTEDAPVQFWTVNKDDQGEHYYNMVADIATKKVDGSRKRNYSNLCRCVTQDQFSSHVPSARELKTYVFYESDRTNPPRSSPRKTWSSRRTPLSYHDRDKNKGLFDVKWRRVVLDEGWVRWLCDLVCGALLVTVVRSCFFSGCMKPTVCTFGRFHLLLQPCHQEPQDEVGRGVHELRGRTAVGPDRHADPELRERPLLPRHVPTPRAVRQSQMVEQILCEAVEARRLYRSVFLIVPIFPPALALYCALTPDQYPTLHLRFNVPPSPGSRGHLAPQAPHALRLPALYQGHVLRRLPHPRLPGIESFLHRIVFTDEVPPLEDEVKSAESEEQGAVWKDQTEDTVDMKRLVETLQSAIEDNEDCYNCLETLTKTVITPCQHVFD
ncbi:LOW QUALITY PROTEIN: hypothetical protein BC938DRAFT_482446 [Jimgerdemannia flammicorona]|uniref:Uncharacterized protein n=1 Tax=Jimgerdemannia flammicorona TaxID=994334 RepID=A0A433QDY1_9FUNG|nr:LOW QUALITY PROTEIN: hypothetical protein BC938DRAFT_482446 [Jimgerdemannia flammicorona]